MPIPPNYLLPTRPPDVRFPGYTLPTPPNSSLPDRPPGSLLSPRLSAPGHPLPMPPNSLQPSRPPGRRLTSNPGVPPSDPSELSPSQSTARPFPSQSGSGSGLPPADPPDLPPACLAPGSGLPPPDPSELPPAGPPSNVRATPCRSGQPADLSAASGPVDRATQTAGPGPADLRVRATPCRSHRTRDPRTSGRPADWTAGPPRDPRTSRSGQPVPTPPDYAPTRPPGCRLTPGLPGYGLYHSFLLPAGPRSSRLRATTCRSLRTTSRQLDRRAAPWPPALRYPIQIPPNCQPPTRSLGRLLTPSRPAAGRPLTSGPGPPDSTARRPPDLRLRAIPCQSRTTSCRRDRRPASRPTRCRFLRTKP